MASPHLKRKQPSQPYGSVIMGGSSPSGSCSPSPGGDNFGLSPLAPTPRDGRKRRKDKLITWVKHTLTPYFDGRLWRKYGQKTIKDAPYPRLYFRCSYREDRHCLASKLVQQVTHDNPPLYEVTYMYEHTCNAAPIPGHDVGDAEPPAASGGELVLTFGSSGGGNHHRGAGSRQLQGQQKNNLPAVLSSSPFFMKNFDDGSKNGSKLQAFPSHVPPPPPAAPSWSPSFPIIESSSAPPPSTSCSASFSIIESSSLTQPSTDDEEGDMFSTMDWDSLLYDLDDQLHFNDCVQFPCNTYNTDHDF